jgi:phosphate uptake regulator
MERRKVQQVGYSTLSVSLPHDWVKEVGLKRGDWLFFIPEKDGSLRLMLDAHLEHEPEDKGEFIINCDLCEEPRELERTVIGNYILGRDTLKIVSSKRIPSTHVEEVRNMVRRLLGLGIIEESPNHITLQCSIDPTKFQIETLIRRLSIIVSTMHEEAMQALSNFNRELAEDTIRREDEANMMYWLITRLLLSAQRSKDMAKKIGLQEPSQILDNRMISKYLETIADCAENIAKRVIELEKYKKSIKSETVAKLSQLGELAHTIFQKAMDCIFSGDMKIANSVLEMRQVVDMEEEKLMRELPDVPHLGAIALLNTRIAESGAGIAVIALDRALEKTCDLCQRSVLDGNQRKKK